MKTKLFLISLVFLFSSFCFAEKIHELVYQKNHDAVLDIIEKHKNNPKKLKKLLNSKESYNGDYVRQIGHSFPVNIAIKNGDLEMVKILVENGASLKGKDDRILGHTPLVDALSAGSEGSYLEMVKYLVENGADVNLPGNFAGGSMYPPLAVALLHKYHDIAEFLIQSGANVNWHQHKITILAAAIKHVDGSSNLKLAKAIIDNGANVNFQNKLGETYLHTASTFEWLTEIGMYLMQQEDINVNIKNKFGKTPLDIAYDNKNMRLAHALEKAGAKRGKDLGIKAKVRRSIKKCSNIFAGA